MEVLYFIIGLVIGGLLVIGGSLILTAINERKNYLDPLKKFIDSSMKDWYFIQRVNNHFSVGYQDYVIHGDLSKKQVSIFENGNATIIEIEMNKKEMKYLYDRIEKSFNKQIYQDVTTIDNMILSNNMLQEAKKSGRDDISDTYDIVPTLDDVLDKMNEIGFDNLTKEDIEILKNHGKD